MLDDDASPPSSQDLANDDFLFHLYRGSELLLDNRVHEAKQELEQALGLQPRDAKGQDLLAIVYFRLGLYPRAIAIYERLVEAHPETTTPRINLALCYLKTGQPQAARMELERVLERNPEHARAWGYLGLAFQRLGDIERAVYAFQMGGHEGMARRLAETIPSITSVDGASAASRAAAAEVFDELDRRGVDFVPDAGTSSASSGSWAALEPGRDRSPAPATRLSFAPAPARPGSLPPPGFSDLGQPPSIGPSGVSPLQPTPIPRELLGVGIDEPAPEPDGEPVDHPAQPGGRLRGPTRGGARGVLEAAVETLTANSELPRGLERRPEAAQAQVERGRERAASIGPEAPLAQRADGAEGPVDAQSLARRLLLVWPKHLAAQRTASGLVLLRGGGRVALRLDAVRAGRIAPDCAATPLPRRARGLDADGVLGGAAAPLVSLDGSSALVLAPPPGLELVVLELGPRVVYFRESALVALEGEAIWQNARLPQGDADPAHVVGLSGSGTAILAVPPSMQSLEVPLPSGLLARARNVLGWTSELTLRSLQASEAPARVRGLCSFEGEGMVFVDGR